MSHRDVLLLGRGAVAEEMATWLRSKGLMVHAFTPRVASLGWVDPDLDPRSCIVMDTIANPDDKREQLTHIEAELPEEILVFTSTVAKCATAVAADMVHPERVFGFNPWQIQTMDVVEMARPLQAENEGRYLQALSFWERMNKTAEVVDDTPGLVFPRILAMLVNEACLALSDGIATAKDIDTAMKYGMNYPLGPLEWADTVGLVEVLETLKGLHRELGDDRYRPALFLQKLVHARFTGREVGRGFHIYRDAK